MRLELLRPYDLRSRGSYGMTETSPAISMLPAECHTAGNPKLRSVGRPVPWAEVRTHRPPLTCTAGAILPSAARGQSEHRQPTGRSSRLGCGSTAPRRDTRAALHCTALHCTQPTTCAAGEVPGEQPRQYAKLASSHSVVERPAWSAPDFPWRPACTPSAPRARPSSSSVRLISGEDLRR